MLSPATIPYKHTQLPRDRFVLPGWSVLVVDGPDAAAFLHAQTMNDVLALQRGHWHWNGWLSAKGRVHAVFALLRTGDAAFALVLPDLPAGELGTALQRYVFRSKLRLDASCGWRVYGEFDGAHDPPSADAAKMMEDGAWIFDMGAPGSNRRLHLVPDAHADNALETGGDEAGPRAWFDADLRHGLPRLPATQRDAWTPQMLSLQRLHAYSLSKGCYPGQEIVARTHYLGQSKRGLHLLAGDGLSTGAEVRDGSGGLLGTMVSAHPAGHLALAVLSAFPPDAGLRVAGIEAREEAFVQGLQRPV